MTSGTITSTAMKSHSARTSRAHISEKADDARSSIVLESMEVESETITSGHRHLTVNDTHSTTVTSCTASRWSRETRRRSSGENVANLADTYHSRTSAVSSTGSRTADERLNSSVTKDRSSETSGE